MVAIVICVSFTKKGLDSNFFESSLFFVHFCTSITGKVRIKKQEDTVQNARRNRL